MENITNAQIQDALEWVETLRDTYELDDETQDVANGLNVAAEIIKRFQNENKDKRNNDTTYYTPDNYGDMKIGSKVRDVHFGLTWVVIQKNSRDGVLIQNRPPEGTKIYLNKDNSDMIFHALVDESEV